MYFYFLYIDDSCILMQTLSFPHKIISPLKNMIHQNPHTHTECPKIYRKSVLHLLKYIANHKQIASNQSQHTQKHTTQHNTHSKTTERSQTNTLQTQHHPQNTQHHIRQHITKHNTPTHNITLKYFISYILYNNNKFLYIFYSGNTMKIGKKTSWTHSMYI